MGACRIVLLLPWSCVRVTVPSWTADAGLERLGGVGAAGTDRAAGRRGVGNRVIAEQVGVSRPTVLAWRNRYLAKGINGLADEIGRAGRG
jgi:hypothetical protein